VADGPAHRRTLRYRVLDLAFDDTAVWSLTHAVTVHPRSGTPFEAWPAATVAELRPELEALLREGKVELFPFGVEGSALTLEEALEEIEREDAWLPPYRSGRNGCEVVLTPAGEAEGSATANASTDAD
jgi:hypothetical protein